MAKKKSRAKIKIKFNYDAPVTLTFTLLSILLFLIDIIFLECNLNTSLFRTPAIGGEFQFNFKSISSYLKLFLYVFGWRSTISFFSELVVILLLGARMEERYGSLVIGLMILINTIFTSVLTACCCKQPFSGTDSIVFMLILLDMLFHISKKTISLSSALATGLFIVCLFVVPNQNDIVGVLIVLAGGLCGSLFAFMASPKTNNRKTVKKESKSVSIDNSTSALRTESSTPSSKGSGNSDETIVGSIKF